MCIEPCKAFTHEKHLYIYIYIFSNGSIRKSQSNIRIEQILGLNLVYDWFDIIFASIYFSSTKLPDRHWQCHPRIKRWRQKRNMQQTEHSLYFHNSVMTCACCKMFVLWQMCCRIAIIASTLITFQSIVTRVHFYLGVSF